MTNLVELRQQDHISVRVELPLAGIYYPGGFPVRIQTNSRDVLEAAEEAWGRCLPVGEQPPLQFRVMVHPDGALAETPVHRKQGSLYAVVSGRDNFANLDLNSGFGCIYVSQRTAADHMWLRWYFLESLSYVMLSHRSVAAIHAACVAREGRGFLLCGPSNAGKTTLSYACARAGWTFVTDDATWLAIDAENRIAIGQPRRARFRMDAPSLFPELAPYAVRARPNGKIGIEVPLEDIPEIRSVDRAEITDVVFLERGVSPAGAISLTGGEAVERLLGDMPSYGEETDAMHRRAVSRLREARAWRMRYSAISEALNILETLPIL